MNEHTLDFIRKIIYILGIFLFVIMNILSFITLDIRYLYFIFFLIGIEILIIYFNAVGDGYA